MSKEEKKNIEFQESLYIILKEITTEKLKSFSISINLGISYLFCQIGTIISNEINSRDNSEENNLIKNIAENLQPIFGDYLNDSNLSSTCGWYYHQPHNYPFG